MKQYLLAGVAVLLVSAHASDNPFDLKENFGKLDQDQEVLLGDLKKIAEAQELAEEQALDEDVNEEVIETIADAPQEEAVIEVEVKEVKTVEPVAEKRVVESLETVVEEIPNASKDRLDAMRQRALDASKEESISVKSTVEPEKKETAKVNDEAKEKQALLEAVKQKEAELKQAKQEQIQRIEAKKEAERREVEAYEKQRAEKLAKQKAEAEAAALEKEAKAQKEAKAKQLIQEEANKKQALEAAKSAKLAQEKKKVAPVTRIAGSTKTHVSDINVTREKIDAKLAADKAYEEAVKEMSQED